MRKSSSRRSPSTSAHVTGAETVACGLGRTEYTYCTDEQAMEGFKLLCHLEGIIPALESSHAVGYLIELAPQMDKNQIILVNLSGRGDKDLGTVMQTLGDA